MHRVALSVLLVVLLSPFAACSDTVPPFKDDTFSVVDDVTADAALAELAEDASAVSADAAATDAMEDAAAPEDVPVAVDVPPSDIAPEVAADVAPDAAVDSAVDVAADAVADVATPLGCGGAVSSGTKTASLGFGGKVRSYLVHVPKGYSGSQTYPVVFAFHGLSDNAAKMEAMTGFDALADKEGFLGVYPDGLTDFTGGSWNAGNCCGAAKTAYADDVGFTLAILADLNTHFCTDAKRVFATGFSNGAYMVHRLACEKADVFAAIAPVSGEINIGACMPSRAISVLEFHGTSDPVVPYGGGGMTGGAWSVDETFAFWRDNAVCAEPKAQPISKNGDATCTGFSLCKGYAAVELCVIDKGGHQWPNSPAGASPFVGKMSKDIDATATIWAFFKQHPLP